MKKILAAAVLAAPLVFAGALQAAEGGASAETKKDVVKKNEPYRPKVAAHRGASGFVPEHTLPAKTMAYALGADYIEQDVVMTKDGVLIIMHDPELDTSTDVAQKFPDRKRADGRYYAIDFTYPEIQSLTVTERFDPETGKAVFPNRFPKDSGIEFKVPKFEDELALVKGLNKSTGKDVGVYVEVKEPAWHEQQGKDITRAVIEMLDKYGFNAPDAKAILQIFDYPAVKGARDKGWKGELCMLVDTDGQGQIDDKKVHEWLLTPEGIAEVSKYATIYAPWFSLMAVPNADGKGYTINDIAETARKNGMKVHSWTHRTDKPFAGFENSRQALDAAFKELKLDGMFSDFPGDMVIYLQEEGLRDKAPMTSPQY